MGPTRPRPAAGSRPMRGQRDGVGRVGHVGHEPVTLCSGHDILDAHEAIHLVRTRHRQAPVAPQAVDPPDRRPRADPRHRGHRPTLRVVAVVVVAAGADAGRQPGRGSPARRDRQPSGRDRHRREHRSFPRPVRGSATRRAGPKPATTPPVAASRAGRRGQSGRSSARPSAHRDPARWPRPGRHARQLRRPAPRQGGGRRLAGVAARMAQAQAASSCALPFHKALKGGGLPPEPPR